MAHYIRVRRTGDLQDQEQHDNACDLEMPDRVCNRIAFWRPGIEEEATVHGAVLTWNSGCPVPEDTASYSEDDGGY